MFNLFYFSLDEKAFERLVVTQDLTVKFHQINQLMHMLVENSISRNNNEKCLLVLDNDEETATLFF